MGLTIEILAAIKSYVKKYANGGSGAAGVGIASVEQTTTSMDDGGINIITLVKTDGTQSEFNIKNGSKGSKGIDGHTPVRGVDYWTEDDIQTIQDYVSDAILNGSW